MIDPKTTYRVSMLRPVRVGLAVYRPDQTITMMGVHVLQVLAAAGADEDTMDQVLAAEAIDDTGL